MKIIKADRTHKDEVLRLLDDFRTLCVEILKSEPGYVSTSAKEVGGPVYDQVIDTDQSAIFLVKENDRYIGVATVHMIPQIRKGGYCAEIEEMYVEPDFQGKGVAQELMAAILNWAKQNNIDTIRLESDNGLARAHRFYEKHGFEHYGRAYIKY